MQPCPGPNYPDDPMDIVPYQPFCGQCNGQTWDISNRGGGTAAGIAGWFGGLIQQDFSVTLQKDGVNSWSWSGYAPAPPTEGAVSGNLNSVSCNGEPSVPVGVSISPIDLQTTVIIDPPTREGEGASAQATVDSGSITSVSVESQGSGYASEILLRETPSLTASLTGGGGATLSLTLENDNGTTRNKTWYVESVSVTNPGSGYADNTAVVFSTTEGDTSESGAIAYARTVRGEPTVTAQASGGTGATLSVSLSKSTDYDGLDSWGVSSVSVTAPGSGYTDGESVTFEVGENDYISYGSVAQAVIRTNRSVPTVTVASVEGGSGADLSVSISPDNGSWKVSGITVNSGGTGYQDFAAVTFGVGDRDIVGSEASVYARTGRAAPNIVASASWSGGSGATFSVSSSETTDYQGKPVWSPTSITITNGGSGYSISDYIMIYATDGVGGGFEGGGYAYVSGVDENGAITELTISQPGQFYKSNGIIESVEISYNGGGSYWHDEGTIESVEIQQGGSYYRNGGQIGRIDLYSGGSYYRINYTGQVEYDTPSVRFRSPSGTGAVGVATVDSTLGSPTFGQVTGISVSAGGSNYRLNETGYLLTINAGVGHLDSLYGDEITPTANESDPLDCSNYGSRYASISNRISTNKLELLSKSFKMAYGTTSPFGGPSGSGLDNAQWCYTIQSIPTWYGPAARWDSSFFSFGNGDITCTISPS